MIPSTAKLKKLRRHSWDAENIATVYLDELSPHRFTVYAEDGQKLGLVESYTGQVKTGGTRTFWASLIAESKSSQTRRESQAEAIRDLLSFAALPNFPGVDEVDEVPVAEHEPKATWLSGMLSRLSR